MKIETHTSTDIPLEESPITKPGDLNSNQPSIDSNSINDMRSASIRPIVSDIEAPAFSDVEMEGALKKADELRRKNQFPELVQHLQKMIILTKNIRQQNILKERYVRALNGWGNAEYHNNQYQKAESHFLAAIDTASSLSMKHDTFKDALTTQNILLQTYFSCKGLLKINNPSSIQNHSKLLQTTVSDAIEFSKKILATPELLPDDAANTELITFKHNYAFLAYDSPSPIEQTDTSEHLTLARMLFEEILPFRKDGMLAMTQFRLAELHLKLHNHNDTLKYLISAVDFYSQNHDGQRLNDCRDFIEKLASLQDFDHQRVLIDEMKSKIENCL